MAQRFRISFSRESIWFQIIVPGGSIALCCLIALVFYWQPDACAAVLVLPRWMWIAPGLVLAALGWTRQCKRIAVAAAVVWVIYGLAFTQELPGLLRVRHSVSSKWEAAHNSGMALRVISLNCNGGNERAAAEVAQYRPDIVLFEESPLRPILEGMTHDLLGPQAESFCGYDVSMMARGKISALPVENPESAPFKHARIHFDSGREVEVFVVRLQPYNIRVDLWSPDCWRAQRRIRERQRGQFERIKQALDRVPKDVPVVLGGDFNLPAGDRMFSILNGRISDAFRKAGSGWGDTLDDDLPVLRIDQIWCDEHFRPVLVRAQTTQNSDHRMVICDLLCSSPQ